MIRHIKTTVSSLLANRSKFSVKSKLVIFESDDWGAIRTPSNSAIEELKTKGLDFSKSNYVVDKLEDAKDLELLFNVLSKFKDIRGKSPKFTANSIMFNPDFKKIKDDNFENFHKKNFIQTYFDYTGDNSTWQKFKLGVAENLFTPQFHGREHLNVNRWLAELKKGNPIVLETFNYGCTFSGEGDYSFMESLDWDSKEDFSNQIQMLEEGLDFFYSTFGFHSKSFIAPCYVWDSIIEETIKNKGVNWIQGIRKQIIPTGLYGRYNYKLRSFGETTETGLKNNVRNCFFEPSFDRNFDWVNSCLSQIYFAFLMNKPAVISTHRINYMGGINPENRTQGLDQLELLLKKLIKKFPDVQFISTDELDNFI
jgi:hypothetical protein